jgi:hypothetical protein
MPKRRTRAPRARKPPTLANKGSLITYKDHGKDTCLGPLWHTAGHGTYDPTIGRVDVTKEEAEVHNRELDKAMLEGLDNACEVGPGAMFYAQPEPGQTSNIRVTTFNGTLVAIAHRYGMVMLAFTRDKKGFCGRIKKDADCVWFKRDS